MAETIADIWKRDKETIESKSLAQILSFSGEGKLMDNSRTCQEMREFFDLLPTEQIEIWRAPQSLNQFQSQWSDDKLTKKENGDGKEKIHNRADNCKAQRN